jgi:ABC-type uncharacterized transport system substrate-binding protein
MQAIKLPNIAKNIHLKALTASLASLAIVAFSGFALAHPHVWITSRATILFKGGAMTGLQHEWTFDEMYATMAIEGLDTNKDGKYDRNELQPLAQTNIDGLKDFGYFTAANAGKDALKFAAPVDYWIEYTNNVLTLHFTLPLAEPLAMKGQSIAIQIADPSYFIAFDAAKDNAVTLSADAPKGCAAKFQAPPSTTTQQNLSDAFGAQLSPAGGGGDNVITVNCPP